MRSGSGVGTARSSASRVGVLRVGVERLGRRDLDDAAEVHHRHAVADELHHLQVVGDEQEAQAELLLQVGEQVHDLRLDRHVEGADRLVGDDQASGSPRAPGRCRRAVAARRRTRAGSGSSWSRSEADLRSRRRAMRGLARPGGLRAGRCTRSASADDRAGRSFAWIEGAVPGPGRSICICLPDRAEGRRAERRVMSCPVEADRARRSGR